MLERDSLQNDRMESEIYVRVILLDGINEDNAKYA